MALNKIDAKIRVKRSTVTGEVPTMGPSTDHTDGSWTDLDIYPGEFFVNDADVRLWVGTSTGVQEIDLAGGPSIYLPIAGGTMTGDIEMTSGTVIVSDTSSCEIDLDYPGVSSDQLVFSTDNGTLSTNYISVDPTKTVLTGDNGGDTIIQLRDDINIQDKINDLGIGINKTTPAEIDTILIQPSGTVSTTSATANAAHVFINVLSGSLGLGNTNSVLIGGNTNSMTGAADESVIAAGNTNDITNVRGFIGAGFNNTVSNSDSAIIGGQSHTASGARSAITGGSGNTASNDRNFVGGGNGNTASADMATVVGGSGNVSSGTRSSIIGGQSNSCTHTNSVILGGSSISSVAANTAHTEYLNIQDTGGISYGSGPVQVKLEFDIGGWDMNATSTLNVAHGLSATEWKTIREISGVIRDDSDTTYYTISSSGSNSSNEEVNIESFDSVNIVLNRNTGGFFDSTNFDSAPLYNRGWITITYTPD